MHLSTKPTVPITSTIQLNRANRDGDKATLCCTGNRDSYIQSQLRNLHPNDDDDDSDDSDDEASNDETTRVSSETSSTTNIADRYSYC